MSNSASTKRHTRPAHSSGRGKRSPEEKMTNAQLYAQIGLVILIIVGISAVAFFAT